MIWIALHLPRLSLETFASTVVPAASQPDAVEPPLAIADARAILDANAAARELGVRAGLKRATALALAPQLTIGQAAPARDAEALMAVAHAALAFSPMVVVDPPNAVRADAANHTVLLEVQASLRYFGGLASLHQRLLAALAPLGHRLNRVTATTPLGAALLAQVHRQLDCAEPAATRRAVLDAPVWLLGPGRAHWEALQGMGLHTVADLQRVPRDGLARRFGENVLSELDRALGSRPDPREPIVLPPTFASRIELFARADTGEQLVHGAAVLLARLVAWLSAGHAFVRRFRFVMHHEARSRRQQVGQATDADTTTLEIALAQPSRDSAHLLVLLRERLASLQLPAPTLELSLQAEDIVQRAPPSGELFPTRVSEHEGLTRLVERLQARLGTAQVMRLGAIADHRPERASVLSPAELQGSDALLGTPRASAPPRPARALSVVLPARSAPGSSAARPVWLCSPPQALQARQELPCLDGQPLQLLSGPERIEAGWWDAGLTERDYFIAQAAEGALVWIYRARLPSAAAPMQGWFLQGRFG